MIQIIVSVRLIYHKKKSHINSLCSTLKGKKLTLLNKSMKSANSCEKDSYFYINILPLVFTMKSSFKSYASK